MSPHIAVWLGALSVCICCCLSASIAFADGAQPVGGEKSATTMPSPKPELTPLAVTRIVVEALKKNDANDSGIKLTWKFASPGNQRATGPIEKFIALVKHPEYSPMINCKSVQVRELARDEDSAAELAIITDADGEKIYYIFQLSKQTDDGVKDCWMTDGVLRVEPAEEAAPAKPERQMRDGDRPV